jgi:hypothetical protein
LEYATTNLGASSFALALERVIGSIGWITQDRNTWHSNRRANHYGKVPINEFLVLENATLDSHHPGSSDVVLVRDYLYRIGLPAELVLYIKELARYEPLGRLSEPHNPFHPSNREEPGRYLIYYWRLLVHCDMIARALSMKLPWEELLGNCIVNF